MTVSFTAVGKTEMPKCTTLLPQGRLKKIVCIDLDSALEHCAASQNIKQA